MARIIFNDQKFIDVPHGTNLMQAIIKAGRPIGNSCDGTGICAKCFVQVLSGMKNLSPISKTEYELLKREHFKSDFRISCLVKVLGDVQITTSYW